MSYVLQSYKTFKTKLSWFSSHLLLTAVFCSFFFFFRLGDWNTLQFCPAALLLLRETSIWQSKKLWVQRSNTPQGTIKGFRCFIEVIIPSRRGCFYSVWQILYFTHRLAIAVPHSVQCDLILALPVRHKFFISLVVQKRVWLPETDLFTYRRGCYKRQVHSNKQALSLCGALSKIPQNECLILVSPYHLDLAEMC